MHRTRSNMAASMIGMAVIVAGMVTAVDFSHTPSMAVWPTNWPGTYPDTTGWTESPAGDAPLKPPHYASKLAREGGIRNLVSCYGIVDRGDGRGGFSLASKELLEYTEAMRRGDRGALARGRAGSERPK
jgi:hypothetical protein